MPDPLATAVQHHRDGRLREAEALYRQVLAAEPDHMAAGVNLGHLLLATRRPDEAIACFDRVLRQAPVQPDALHGRGTAYAALQRLDRAEADLRALLAAQPDHAAALNRLGTVLIRQLIDACDRDDPASCLIVEGAGGFYSPLAEDGLNADLASALQLPVIVVVRNRIGAVNQALMTVQAVESRHLRVAAIVLNQTDREIEAAMDNTADLEARCDHPLFHCGHGGQLEPLFEGR